MNEVAVIDREASLVLGSEQTTFTPAQVRALEHIGVEHASPGDLQVFHHVCQRTGLDPFARQIYMIGRRGRAKGPDGRWVDVIKQTIQTGIDGFRLIGRRAADAARHSVSVTAPEWCTDEGEWRAVWRKVWGEPVAARVTIERQGKPFTAVALFDEYAPRNNDGNLTGTWVQRPAGQLAKCAEALAWRMSFPQDLSGLYVEEEMQHIDEDSYVRGEVVETVRSGGLGAALAAQDAPENGSGSEASQSGPSSAPDSVARGDVVSPDPESSDGITDAQMRNIGRLMGKSGLNITDRDEALVKVAVIIGREIESRKDLTKDEASKVIDSLDAELVVREREH